MVKVTVKFPVLFAGKIYNAGTYEVDDPEQARAMKARDTELGKKNTRVAPVAEAILVTPIASKQPAPPVEDFGDEDLGDETNDDSTPVVSPAPAPTKGGKAKTETPVTPTLPEGFLVTEDK